LVKRALMAAAAVALLTMTVTRASAAQSGYYGSDSSDAGAVDPGKKKKHTPTPTATPTATAPLITSALQCNIPDADVVGVHDTDTEICGVDYGASLPPGDYSVVATGVFAVTIGATPPDTLGFDLIDEGGHNLFVLTTSWVPTALLVPGQTISVSASSSSNFTITPEEADRAFVGPSWQVFPVSQDVTVKMYSGGTFQIFQRTPGY
jgi:hypothetical protein